MLTRNRTIAAATLAGLGGLAAVAIAGRPDPVGTAAAPATPTTATQVRTETVRRTVHVRPKAEDRPATTTSAPAAAPPAAAAPAPAAAAAVAATPVAASVPHQSRGRGSDDAGVDDHGGDDDHSGRGGQGDHD